KKDPNFGLVSDYAYWFHNWPCRDGDTGHEAFDEDEGPEAPPPGQWLVTKAVLVCGVRGGLLGAAVGAAPGGERGAGPAAGVGRHPPGDRRCIGRGPLRVPLRGGEPAPLRPAPRGDPGAGRRWPGRCGRRADGGVAPLELRGSHRWDVRGTVPVTPGTAAVD